MKCCYRDRNEDGNCDVHRPHYQRTRPVSVLERTAVCRLFAEARTLGLVPSTEKWSDLPSISRTKWEELAMYAQCGVFS